MVSFDASEIVNWSDLPDAHHQLPELVRRLVQATAKVLDIDMPSGSSVRLGGWDGLVTATEGRPWVPEGHSGWEFSCNKAPGVKATSDYDKRTADPLSVEVANATFIFVTSRRWPGKREWARERREQGPWADVRAFDADDLVAWLEQAPEVATWFAQLGHSSPDMAEIRKLVRHGEEFSVEAQRETLQHMDAGLDDLKAHMTALLSSNSASLGGPAGPEGYSDPDSRALAARIDVARDLISENKVSSAKVVLEQIRNQAETIPVGLEFRVVTNLAVCALANDDFDRARSFLEEAQRLQPESPAAIANAALAAQLAEDPERAILLAGQARALEPKSPQATAVLMQALWKAGNPEQLEDLVAAEEWITRDRHCASILATIRQQQSRFDDAAALYQYLIESDSEDAHAHLALSQCLLIYSQADHARGRHTENVFTRLREAEHEATRAIDIFRTTELRVQLQNALVARACARALLEASSDALTDLEEVLAESPHHPVAAFNKGLLLQREGRFGEARSLLESIQDPARRADAVLPLAESYLADGDGASAVGLTEGTFQLDHPEWEDIHKAGVMCRAEALETGDCSVRGLLSVALKHVPENPRLLTLDGMCLSTHGDPVGAEENFLNALEYADETDRPQILALLGFNYRDLSRFSEAADCFAEIVCGVASHSLAIPLMVSLVNGRRWREALHWAREIQQTHRQIPRIAFEVEAWILGHVGDVDAAASCYQRLCLHPDATPADHITLAWAQFRCGDHEAAMGTTLSIDTSEPSQDPQLLLQVAQLKCLLGAEGYLEDVYLARRHGIDDPDVHLGYMQLLLRGERDRTEPVAVGPGCAVRLREAGEEKWWHILDEGEEIRGQLELASNDGLAQRLLGLGAGESIVVPGFIENRRYEIVEVQSKFVRAFQETVEEFPTRFPEDASLLTFTVKDDDLTNLFKFTDQRPKAVRSAQDLYLAGRLPLATFASLIGRSAVEVWRANIRGPSGRIWIGADTVEQVRRATTILQDTDSVVLDLLALLTVRELGIEEQLRKRFQRITVPQQVVDELHETLFNTQEMTPVGYLGSDGNGQGILTEVSEQDWIAWIAYVRSVLELAMSFEHIASYRLLDTDDSQQLFDVLTRAGAGAVFAGDEQSANELLLVSDDHALSLVARSFGINAVNTQAVLEELRRSDVITGEKYSSLVERLTQLNYWFVRVSAEDILRSLEVSGYTTTEGSRAMLRTLQGPDCDEATAISIMADVMIGLVDKAAYEQLELILSITMAALCRGRITRPVLLKFRNRIASRLALHPRARNQILRTVDTYIHTSSIIV